MYTLLYATPVAVYIILSSTEANAEVGTTEEGIKLINIFTQPSVVNVGNVFRLNTTVVNDLSNDIVFTGEFCGYSSLSAEFNKNVRVLDQPNVGRCTAMKDITLKSGEKTSLSGPDVSKSYLASAFGMTNAEVTFQYMIQENDSFSSANNISQSFSFRIYP
jgi:hypothetical protein